MSIQMRPRSGYIEMIITNIDVEMHMIPFGHTNRKNIVYKDVLNF
jgi:hypothetical protein